MDFTGENGINAAKARLLWTLAGLAFLLLVWEIAARMYGSGLLLPGPVLVFASFTALLLSPRFFAALLASFVRVAAGIAIAVPLGLAAGIAAGLDRRIHAFLRPMFTVISATPVISVILIAFLFLGAGRTPVFTAFLMVFPVMAANTLEGVKSTDSNLRELFTVFKMSRFETLRFLFLPSLVPFIMAGLRSSLSLCWKVVVAAEVLVQPVGSLGAGMQQARAHLATSELFAWTIGALCAAALCQGVLTLVIKLCTRRTNGKRFVLERGAKGLAA